jgi:hypothetical protein
MCRTPRELQIAVATVAPGREPALPRPVRQQVELVVAHERDHAIGKPIGEGLDEKEHVARLGTLVDVVAHEDEVG